MLDFRFSDWSYSISFENTEGSLAQLVEQRTENPCVAGSIPAGATIIFEGEPGYLSL